MAEMGTLIYDIEMVRGDTLEFTAKIEDFTGTVSAVSFGCRVNALDTGNYVFQKTLGSGITSLGNGEYDVRVAPADTASLTPGLYDYDLQFTIGSDVYTPMLGKLRLLADTTH